ncbi:MAG: hypothetical protein RQ724_09700, partial [Desulfuromonadales bacterium]|nr:hypothetical protein [Desulfuromonadales bacterium]
GSGTALTGAGSGTALAAVGSGTALAAVGSGTALTATVVISGAAKALADNPIISKQNQVIL